ncbi:hypothetical protein evm_009404 [Chilo suppressalis]|nr:hypothetical protein evm_009404 [Chilo suppressalis]
MCCLYSTIVGILPETRALTLASRADECSVARGLVRCINGNEERALCTRLLTHIVQLAARISALATRRASLRYAIRAQRLCLSSRFPLLNSVRRLMFDENSKDKQTWLLGAYTQAFSLKVQLSRIYVDSKTFVDMRLIQTENETLADFSKLMHDTNKNPSREQLASFVDDHFMEGNELLNWMPPDFDPEPPILNEIVDPKLKSYYEDYMNALQLPHEQREDFYLEMKSAAESGWDFSTRWFVTAGDVIGHLTDVHATRILPVDLNAIFAGALELAGDFRSLLKDRREAQKWYSLAKYWRRAIDNVMWDPDDGVWYDYDAQARALRKHFYPSCATPLWSGAVEKSDAPVYAEKFVKYLRSSGGLDFPGGVPSSVLYSGEHILIGGLDASGNKDAAALAKEQAKIWIRANYIGGGEYKVQEGFGWTNGVALELLKRYGKELFMNDQVTALPYVRQWALWASAQGPAINRGPPQIKYKVKDGTASDPV